MTLLELEKKLNNIQYLKSTDDFFQVICELSELFKLLKAEDCKKIIQNNIHIKFIENVFLNPYFNEILLKVLKTEKDFLNSDGYKNLDKLNALEEKKKINFPEKQLIQTALYLASFVLTNIFKYLSKNDILYLRQIFLLKLEIIIKNQNKIYTLTDVCFILYDIICTFDYTFNKQMAKKYDFNFVFKCNQISRCLIGSMMLIIPQINVFQFKFKKIIRQQKKMDVKFSVLRGLCEIYNISRKIIGGLKHFKREYKKNNNKENFNIFLDNFTTNNEKNILYIFENITSDFHIQQGKIFSDVILQKINNAKKMKKNIFDFSKNNLQAFGGMAKDRDEWSNKVYLISNKLLSTLEIINNSSDVNWKVNVAIYELSHWIDNTHQILNKYDIEDDWDKIEKFVKQEDSNIEWKSTFLTPTEELFIDDQSEKKKSKIILFNIVKVMLGMMNTDGGMVIIGLVENPQSIKREDIKKNLIIKNNFTFFNVNYEFKKKKKNIDNTKREIQDMLFKETLYTAEKFNHLWSIEQIQIKNNYSVATIYKIEIKKSNNYIYSVKKEKEIQWITLIKRADGRTIRVDPREYLNNGNINLT